MFKISPGFRCIAIAALGLMAANAWAETVSLVGVFPGKAVLVLDGGSPRTLSVGQSSGSVRLVAVERDAAVVEIEGKRSRISVGESPVSLDGGNSGSGAQIVLAADAQGHFFSNGAINGASVRFLVDTGASTVSMGPSVATRAGINYLKGQPAMSSTANGIVQVWRVNLDTVTIGSVTLRNVEGVVVPRDMPEVLLGMSVLNRMEMKREGASMVLKRRY